MLILVVDDDEDYAEIIAQALRRDSHDVVTVGDGAGAVKFAEAKSPDLAILDVMLPDTNGLQLCKRIRQRLPTLPVIFLSSLDRTDDVVAGLESGGDDYITKPDRKSTRLNSSHPSISYAVFCLKKKNKKTKNN